MSHDFYSKVTSELGVHPNGFGGDSMHNLDSEFLPEITTTWKRAYLNQLFPTAMLIQSST